MRDDDRLGVARFGWWASLAAGVTTLLAFGLAIATPPLSGPWCREGCFRYPYLAIAERFPRDYAWMPPAIVATLCQLAFLVALGAWAAPARRLVGQLGVALGVMAALTIVADYAVQLAVVQPSLLAGEADGIALLSQYNPHGLFIALEELGYTLLITALALLALALPASSRLERAVRWLFLGAGAVTAAALGSIGLLLGHRREYIFEIAVISIAWLALPIGAFLMAPVFLRARRRAS